MKQQIRASRTWDSMNFFILDYSTFRTEIKKRILPGFNLRTKHFRAYFYIIFFLHFQLQNVSGNSVHSSYFAFFLYSFLSMFQRMIQYSNSIPCTAGNFVPQIYNCLFYKQWPSRFYNRSRCFVLTILALIIIKQ